MLTRGTRQQLEELGEISGFERTAQLHTVDSFQGKEAEVVVVSLVRKTHARGSTLDRLPEPARAGQRAPLPRPAAALTPVGDYEHFRNTDDPTWRAVCRELRRAGVVLDAESVLRHGEPKDRR